MQRLVSVCLFFCTLVAFGQTDSIISLPEVEITAPGIDVKSHKTSVTSHEISAAEIQNTPARNVAEAGAWLPGIYLQDYGGVGGVKTISSRGLAANYTQIFMDGLQVENSSVGQVDLGKISLLSVSKIQFSNGIPEAELLPASAYLLPHSFVMSSDEVTKDELRVEYTGGAFGTINPKVSIKHKINNKIKVSAGIDYTHANGAYKYLLDNGVASRKATRSHAGINRFLANYKAQFLLADSHEIKISGYCNVVNQQLPGAVILYEEQGGEQLKTRDFLIGVSYKKIMTEKWIFQWQHSANFQGLNYRDDNYHNSEGFLTNSSIYSVFNNSLMSRYQLFKDVSLNSAIDYRYTTLSNDVLFVRNQVIMSNEVKFKYRNVMSSAHAAYQWLSDQEKTDASNFNYGYSFVFYPFKKSPFQLHGSFSKNHRYPTFYELYFQRVFVTLIPEKSALAYVGMATLLTSKNNKLQCSLNTDVFTNRTHDKIVSLPTQNLFVWSTRNLGEVDIKGTELSCDSKLAIDTNFLFSLKLSYTYQQALDVTDPSAREYKRQLAYTPIEILKSNMSFSYKKTALGWGLMYNGYRYSMGENTADNLLDAWSVHHLFLKKDFVIKKCNYSVLINANNIFNTSYQIIKNFPMPGRHYYFTLSAQL